MKIAVSGDCLNVFTSAYPVRGMLFELIKLRESDEFVIFYTNREINPNLKDYYEKLHNLKNVSIKYFKNTRIIVGLKRFFTLSSYININDDFDLFWNPSYLEYVRGFQGIQLANITDLSILKGFASIPHPKIWKIQNKIAKKYYFKQKNLNIVSISQSTLNDIKLNFNNVKSPITVIHNGIADFWHNSIYADISHLKNTINGNYFIWWGFISRRKNIISLIKAYNNAKSKDSSLPLLLLVGGIADHMVKIMQSLDLTNVIHIPFQDDYTIKTLVKNSSGLIFPSFYEGFGLPIIEAFSQGIPVACSNTTSLPEIADGKALLFDPDNILSITNAILDLSKFNRHNPELIQYARKFTYKKMAMAYNKLLNQLMASKLKN